MRCTSRWAAYLDQIAVAEAGLRLFHRVDAELVADELADAPIMLPQVLRQEADQRRAERAGAHVAAQRCPTTARASQQTLPAAAPIHPPPHLTSDLFHRPADPAASAGPSSRGGGSYGSRGRAHHHRHGCTQQPRRIVFTTCLVC